MKIILVTTFFHPVIGGVESQVLSLSKNLLERGHEVEVITSDSAKNKGRIKEKNDEIAGVKVTRCFTWFGLSYFHKFYPDLFFKLMKKDFDVVHVHGFRKFEVYAALLAAKLKKKKVVVSTHNPFVVEKKSRGGLLNFFIKLHDATFGKWFSKSVDHYIALSKSEIEILSKFNVDKKKISVIPNGINDLFFEKGDRNKFIKDFGLEISKWKNVVVGAGRLHVVKGFQNLKHAVHKLTKTLFIIAGADDGYLDKLKKIYSTYENIIFLERNLSQEQLNNMFSIADLFVYPSLHEAFGIGLVEAMASGLPVVSTNVGGPRDIVKPETGVLLDPKDLGAWESKIKWLLTDDEARQKMSEAARKSAALYKWDKIIVQTEKVYKSLK